MERFARQQGLLVRTYTPRMVKKMICGHGDATKRDLAETLIRQRYHFLAKYLQRDLRTRDKYWQSITTPATHRAGDCHCAKTIPIET